MAKLLNENYEKLMSAGRGDESLPCGLAGGTAGLALLAISPSDDVVGLEEQRRNFFALLQKSSQSLRRNFNPQAGLFSGLSGYMAVLSAGTVAGHVGNRQLSECEPLMREVLSQKIRKIRTTGWNQLFYSYDVVEGIAGDVLALRYISENHTLSDPLKAEIRVALQVILEGISSRGSSGPKALFLPEFYPSNSPWYRQQAPNGGYILGYAHGIPGLLAGAIAGMQLVGNSSSADIQTLFECLDWFLEFQQEDGNWPNMVPLETEDAEGSHKRSRLAWCYGSPGILPVLMHAQRDLGYRNASHAIARAISGIDSAEIGAAGDISPTFCHGWTGIAEALGYVSSSRKDVHLEAKRSAYVSAIEKRLLSDRDTVYGVLDWETPSDRIPKLGLLEGASGVLGYQFARRSNSTNSEFYKILNSYSL